MPGLSPRKQGKLKFGGATEGVLIDAFSDGRLCSVVKEHVLPEYFQNLVRCSSMERGLI